MAETHMLTGMSAEFHSPFIRYQDFLFDLAETSVMSPLKNIYFDRKIYIYRIKVSRKRINKILEKNQCSVLDTYCKRCREALEYDALVSANIWIRQARKSVGLIIYTHTSGPK